MPVVVTRVVETILEPPTIELEPEDLVDSASLELGAEAEAKANLATEEFWKAMQQADPHRAARLIRCGLLQPNLQIDGIAGDPPRPDPVRP